VAQTPERIVSIWSYHCFPLQYWFEGIDVVVGAPFQDIASGCAFTGDWNTEKNWQGNAFLQVPVSLSTFRPHLCIWQMRQISLVFFCITSIMTN
jgi:hypothetical protein